MNNFIDTHSYFKGKKKKNLNHPLTMKEHFTSACPLGHSVQSFSRVRLLVTPWTEAHQASLSIISPWACSNSCPLWQWCHPIISSSVIPFSSCLQSFSASGSFQMSQFFASRSQSTEVSASTSVLPMNIQDWFPLGWNGWTSLQSKGVSRVFYNTTVQNIYSLALNFLYGPTLTSIHDHWKNHSFDQTDLRWQSNVSAF